MTLDRQFVFMSLNSGSTLEDLLDRAKIPGNVYTKHKTELFCISQNWQQTLQALQLQQVMAQQQGTHHWLFIYDCASCTQQL